MADDRKKKEKLLKEAINRSILVDDEEKVFWLENVSTLPDPILDNVLKAFSSNNEITDEYINTAIKDNPDKDYFAEIKNKVMQIKKAAIEMDEEESKAKLDEDLEKQIKNLLSQLIRKRKT